MLTKTSKLKYFTLLSCLDLNYRFKENDYYLMDAILHYHGLFFSPKKICNEI